MASVKSQLDRSPNGRPALEKTSIRVNKTDYESDVQGVQSDGVELTSFHPGSVDHNDQAVLITYDENPSSEDSGTSGLGKASYNMINSIIGAGIIGLPFAVAQAGFILGVFFLFAMAVLTDFSLRLLVETGLLIGVTSYQATMEKLFGKIGFYYLSVCQFFYPFFAMIGYTIIVGDTIPKVLDQAGAGGVLIDPHFIKFVVTLLVMWPLSLYRDISKLGKVSFLAILCILFLCVVVLIKAGTNVHSNYDPPPFEFVKGNVAQSLSIMVFAYMCHHNTFLIYTSLERPSLKRYSTVVHVSVFAAAIVAFSLALGGYITFRSDIVGDLLKNYCIDDTLVNVSRIGYAFVVMFTFPIEMFVCREVISISVSWFRKTSHTTDTLRFHVITTLVTGAVVMAIGIPVGNLGVVLEFSGSLFGTPLAFIFPPVAYLRATKGQAFGVKRICAVLVMVFGVLLTIMGTVVAIIEASEGLTSNDGDPSYCGSNASDVANTTTLMPMSVPVSIP